MSESNELSQDTDHVFPIKVRPPEDVGHDAHRLREWLSTMSFELMDAEDIEIYETPDPDAGGTDWVTVTLTVKPCSGKGGGDDQESVDEGGDG